MTFRLFHRPVEDLGGVRRLALCYKRSRCGFSSRYRSSGRRLVSRCKCRSAVSASQSAAVWFRCSSEVNVRPLSRLVSRVGKRPFHFTFRLRPMGAACPWLIAVVRGERQEMRVVNRLFPVVARYHHLHVVVETGVAHRPSKYSEGPHVFPDRGGEVLSLHKPHTYMAAGGKPECS